MTAERVTSLFLLCLVLTLPLGFLGGFETLWSFSIHPAHRDTSLALLMGSLRYPRELASGIPFVDLQIFNGSLFTNWGYGVPILQAPFHIFSQVTGIGVEGMFPDRLIFFFYFSVTFLFLIPSLVTFFNRQFLHATTTAFAIMVFGLLWLIAGRFHVYEETLAYFALAQIAALSILLKYLQKPSLALGCTLGAFAGLALLIRPTGAPYLILWLVILFWSHRNRKDAVAFLVATLPFIAVWLATNFVRTGNAFSVGQANATPGSAFHLISRFHSPCMTSWKGVWE